MPLYTSAKKLKVWKECMAAMDESRLRMTILNEGMVVSAAIRAVVVLNVPDILNQARTKLSAREIVAQIPSSSSNPKAAEYLDRIMSVLTMNRIFDKSSDGLENCYGLNELSKHLVCDGNDESIAYSVLLFLGKEYALAWQCLHEAVLDGGEPFRKAHDGKSAFELGAEDPQIGRLFNLAMSNHTRRSMRLALETYDGFKDAKVLVDVGGGLGTSLKMIVAKYPDVRGINFDLPHVVEQAPQQSGVENVGGDMFESVPCGDMILLKWILHDWDDARAINILRNCHKSLPATGKVVVLDAILPEQGSNYSLADKQTCLFDLVMLTGNPGGKERSKRNFEAIAKAAGFASLSVKATFDFNSIIELYKV